jgi:hypothetical protein
MRIQQRRVRNLKKHLPGIDQGDHVVIALIDPKHRLDRLREVGLGDGLTLGDSVLPARIGPVSRFNAEGRWEVHRDRPKETVTRQSEWTWEQWAGRGLTETHSKIVDIPYQRYPRTLIPPPSVEISVAEDGAGREIVRTPEITFLPENEDALKHQVNLFLELFGECEVLSGDLEPRLAPELRRLNWRILPPGKHPWSKLRRVLKPVLDEAKRGNRPVVSHRLEFLGGFDPEFAAVGLGGFSGYTVFGFPEIETFVVESAHYGNATYVFGEDWARLSQMTKAEIIEGGLHRERIIHRVGWEGEMRRVLQS